MTLQILTQSQIDVIASNIIREQRTEKGVEYERLRKNFETLKRLAKSSPEHKSMLDAIVHGDEPLTAKHAQLMEKGVPSGSVHSNTFLSNMSVMYANDEFIGEQLVRPVPVSKRSDDFAVYPRRERFEFPDDAMGSRSKANEISETRDTDNYSVKDYALSNFVTRETLDNQDAIFDEKMDLVDSVNEGLAHRRELRISSLLTTASNYSGNAVTLAGSDQWDSAAGGDPIGDIQAAVAATWSGRGATELVGFCSLSVFLVLSRHQQLLDLYKYTKQGLLNRQQIASLLGLSDLLVCASRKQTANEGQTASYSRIWGLDFGIVRRAARPSRRCAHFASIFRMSDHPVTTQWEDASIGVSGGEYVKVGVSEDLKVVASPTGYLIKAAVGTAV